MYKPNRKMPMTGQFIAIWTYNNNVWTDNFKWRGGSLFSFNDEGDSFSKDSHFPTTGQENIIYVQLEEDE